MTFPSALQRSALLATTALVLLASACAQDTVVNPIFGAGCDAGRLAPGKTRGALNENSCVETYNPWTSYRSAYASHGMSLERDKAYMLTVLPVADPSRNGRNGLDPVLTVYGVDGRGPARPLAISDDDGADRGSELFFFPLRTGTYRAQISSYYSALEVDALGGYEVAFTACPVLSLRPDTGATEFTLPESACYRTGEGDIPTEIAYRFIRVPVAAYEELTIRFTAADFTPFWEAHLKGMDSHGRLNAGDQTQAEGELARTLYNDSPDAGYATIAVGVLDSTGPSRRITLHLSRRILDN